MAKKTKKKAAKKAASLAPAFDWKVYLEKKQAEEEKNRQTLLQKLRTLGIDLYARGITIVSFEYNGEGDSGGMDYCHYEKNSAFGDKNEKDITDEEREILQDLAWSFVPSGFENNDGGFGEVTFNLATKTISARHSDRIVEVETSERDFNFDGEQV